MEQHTQQKRPHRLPVNRPKVLHHTSTTSNSQLFSLQSRTNNVKSKPLSSLRMFKIPKRCLQLPEKNPEQFLPQEKPLWLSKNKKTTKTSKVSLNCTQSSKKTRKKSPHNPTSRSPLEKNREPKVQYSNTSRNNSFFTNLKTHIQRRPMKNKSLKKTWTKTQMTPVMSLFLGLESLVIVDRFKKKKKWIMMFWI